MAIKYTLIVIGKDQSINPVGVFMSEYDFTLHTIVANIDCPLDEGTAQLSHELIPTGEDEDVLYYPCTDRDMPWVKMVCRVEESDIMYAMEVD